MRRKQNLDGGLHNFEAIYISIDHIANIIIALCATMEHYAWQAN
jgi:hypothetical protein